MPRHISFYLTTPQFEAGLKDVTRRMGWLDLAAGDELWAVEKSQGLGKGGKVRKLCMIHVVSVRREPLRWMLDDPEYGRAECAREGFPAPHVKSDPAVFVTFFCETHVRCTPESVVTRIEFVKLKGVP